MVQFKYFLYILSLCLHTNNGIIHGTRNQKFLEVFSIFRFANCECVINEVSGICYSSQECNAKGGRIIGGCANGFGSCCLFEKSCGSMSRENLTFMVSPPVITSGTCSLKYCTDGSVCQIRIDFETFRISGPFSAFDAGTVRPQESLVSQCLNDFFSVTSPGSKSAPIICGINDGYHMYVDACPSCNTLTFSLASQPPLEGRQWRLKLTQVECTSKSRAPDGCLQYFTTNTGILNSFNNGGFGTHLASQDYTICIRSNANMCSICYWGDPFEISNAFDSVGGKSEYDEKCGIDIILDVTDPLNPLQNEGLQDYITIPEGRCLNEMDGGIIDRYCGEILACSTDLDNAGTQLTQTSSVCSSFTPFEIRVFTDEFEEQTNEDGTGPDDGPQVGFRIFYQQQTC